MQQTNIKIHLALICPAKCIQRRSKKPLSLASYFWTETSNYPRQSMLLSQLMPWCAAEFGKSETWHYEVAQMMEKHAMAPFMVYCGQLCKQIMYMARLEAFWPLMTNWKTTHTRDVEFTETLGSSFGGSGLCSKFPGKCLLPLVWNKTLTFLKSLRNAPVPSLHSKMGWFRRDSGVLGRTSVPASHTNPSLEC